MSKEHIQKMIDELTNQTTTINQSECIQQSLEHVIKNIEQVNHLYNEGMKALPKDSLKHLQLLTMQVNLINTLYQLVEIQLEPLL